MMFNNINLFKKGFTRQKTKIETLTNAKKLKLPNNMHNKRIKKLSIFKIFKKNC